MLKYSFTLTFSNLTKEKRFICSEEGCQQNFCWETKQSVKARILQHRGLSTKFGSVQTHQRHNVIREKQSEHFVFNFLTHIELSRSMAVILEMPQYVAYLKNIA